MSKPVGTITKKNIEKLKIYLAEQEKKAKKKKP